VPGWGERVEGIDVDLMTDAPEVSEPTQAERLDAEAIKQILLRRICHLQYKAGDQLKEAELAREFGVSRTPVRDAINRISHYGLIASRNGVGTIVVGLSAEEIKHVYEVRLELATLIGRLSPVTPEAQHIETISRLLTQTSNLKANFSAADYVSINHELNELIGSLIGNHSLRAMWMQLYVKAASTWHRVADDIGPKVADDLIDELTDVLSACEQGDIEALGHIQRVHIGYGYARIKRVFGID
jgi:DNA-binding GntR family transcriptional regulator